MTAIVSTYRHDYTPPKISRYDFLAKVDFSRNPCTEPCPCLEEKPQPNLSKLGEQCETQKWTSPAQPGKLEMPRRITERPVDSSNDQTPNCWQDRPNRFLKTIANTYPALYERLKNMPQDELRRSIENSRFRSTYQVDYCHLDEHPTALYGESQEKKDELDYRQSKLNEPCEMFSQPDNSMKGCRPGGDAFAFGGGRDDLSTEEIKMYKPVKTNTGAEAVTRPGTGHWDAGLFSKQLTLTEYMDTMDRTGLIIVENNLHDHSKCRGGKSCVHVIKRAEPKGLKLRAIQPD